MVERLFSQGGQPIPSIEPQGEDPRTPEMQRYALQRFPELEAPFRRFAILAAQTVIDLPDDDTALWDFADMIDDGSMDSPIGLSVTNFEEPLATAHRARFHNETIKYPHNGWRYRRDFKQEIAARMTQLQTAEALNYDPRRSNENESMYVNAGALARNLVLNFSGKHTTKAA